MTQADSWFNVGTQQIFNGIELNWFWGKKPSLLQVQQLLRHCYVTKVSEIPLYVSVETFQTIIQIPGKNLKNWKIKETCKDKIIINNKNYKILKYSCNI